MTWEDDEDDEAKAWDRLHRNSVRRGSWKFITVQLETRRGFMTLTRDEWNQLQKFLSIYDTAEKRLVTKQSYANLPKKVRILIEDWLNHVAGADSALSREDEGIPRKAKKKRRRWEQTP